MNPVDTPTPGHRKKRGNPTTSRSLWHLIDSFALALAKGYGLYGTHDQINTDWTPQCEDLRSAPSDATNPESGGGSWGSGGGVEE